MGFGEMRQVKVKEGKVERVQESTTSVRLGKGVKRVVPNERKWENEESRYERGRRPLYLHGLEHTFGEPLTYQVCRRQARR